MFRLSRWWEVPDNIPNCNVDGIACMTLAFRQDGSCSNILKSVIHRSVALSERFMAGTVVFANQFQRNGKNEAIVARDEAIRFGLNSARITIPSNPWHPRIRNTFEEARFSLRLLRFSRSLATPRLLVVANHLHMRRALAAFRKLSPHGRGVELYWVSVEDRSAYGSDSAQARFMHPLLFLGYELSAYLYSKLRGWA